ncbi:hypothetical protein HK100_009305, partial [Physocladia obscura]
MAPAVPLVVPTANAHHLDVLSPLDAFVVTNANCATTGLVVPLKALLDAFGPISELHVVSQQAISGAGYPGVPSLDITENVVPFISGEEDKLESEPQKILGHWSSDAATFVHEPTLKISATCTRVPVIDGHLMHVSFKFADSVTPKPSLAQIIKAFEDYSCDEQTQGCPSAPRRPIVVMHEVNRPQPRLDRDTERGYAVCVGRVRECPLLDFKFTLLVHNTILGAAGSSLLNAEI